MGRSLIQIWYDIMNIKQTVFLFALLLPLFPFGGLLANQRSPISSYQNAVLQRDQPIVINGKARGRSGDVTVTFHGQERTAKYSYRKGRFSVEFPAMPAGGPYVLDVTDQTGTYRAEDIYVGDIWVCVGQSNMMFPMTKMHKPATWQPAAKDNYPLVRMPGKNGWRRSDSIEVIKNMPGTPYYFGRELHRELGIAIGLIPAGAGGTSLWEWTPSEAHELEMLKPYFEVMQSRVQYWKDGHLPDKAGVNDYPPAKGFSSARYPYFPKKGFANQGLVNLENWVGKRPSRGIVFWQGENDIGLAANYEHLFRVLIQRYREKAGREFPFFFIQLPTYTDRPGAKTKYDGIVGLRDAQRRVAETEKNVEMVVTYDIYSRGIHPAKKQEYGIRLARAVLGKIYGKDLDWVHAKYDRIEVQGERLLIHFKDAGSGLKTTDDKPPRDFTLAGKDRVFFPATATVVDEDTIALSSAEVPNPVAVRYAWQNSPATNLVGDGGLPISPFRSDDWELYPVPESPAATE